MIPIDTRQELEVRAAEALRAVLGQVSAARLREIRRPLAGAPSAGAFTACVDVYGQPYTLECEVAINPHPVRLRTMLAKLCGCQAGGAVAATPVIIAPHLSAEAQALCRECEAGFLDFDGNARLSLGEVFILKRTIPHVERRAVAHEFAFGAASHHAA